ncbi:MAG: tRNA (adenosine(37)-N6)-threonylcarbamoyltransferase complex transferase subunit TsaD [Actinomycetota bacterium]|nr:tRNA (adenosine(37)-N6)-threonylcarbamoyltransferase complex transferase subunit TsaD [Actinomycetota bacterium]
MKILAIETSCDETAAAVVEDGRHVLSSVVSSQVDIHVRFGGVVPEVASRAHVELLTPVVAESMLEAGVDGPGPGGIGAVAATVGPGLIGSLLVGMSAAKAYALAWGVPFVAVNHMEAHLHAAFLEERDLALPVVVLLVSGGHTLLIAMEAASPTGSAGAGGSGDGGSFPFRYRLLGQTIDDAAGEAFDKVARFLGLGYPGGPAIDALAGSGNPAAIAFPRGMREEGYDFSFSGLKTSVINYVRKHPDVDLADVSASFQEAVVDVLVTKAIRAAREIGARGICIGGGVAANSALRERILEACADVGIGAFVPSRAMCTDNAAMIGATAWHRLRADGPTSLAQPAVPNLALPYS